MRAIRKAPPFKKVDSFSVGPLDLVTERTNSAYLSASAIVLVPAIAMCFGIVLYLKQPVNAWTDGAPVYVDILDFPSDMIMGELCCHGTFRLMVSNQYSLPLRNVSVSLSVAHVLPDPDYSMCSDLIAGSLEAERLQALCTPGLQGAENLTDVNGLASFEVVSVVAGVPGMYTFNVSASLAVKGRLGSSYIPYVTKTVSLHVSRNFNVEIIPSRFAPDEIEYGVSFVGYGSVCTTDAARSQFVCAHGSRDDLKPPSATLTYAGTQNVSSGVVMSLFTVGHMKEILQPDVRFGMTKNPHGVGSYYRHARITNGSTISFSSPVSESGYVEFSSFSVLGANNPSMFFAFYACGTFALWNKNWIEDGQLYVQEMAILPPNNTKGQRAALGDRYVGDGPADGAGEFDDNGQAIGDKVYLTQIELADYLPTQVLEGETFTVRRPKRFSHADAALL